MLQHPFALAYVLDRVFDLLPFLPESVLPFVPGPPGTRPRAEIEEVVAVARVTLEHPRRRHVERLEEIFSELEEQLDDHHCKGMEGLIAEGKEMLEEDPDDGVRDAGIIAAAQRVEHYEIAGYGTALTYAQMLNENAVVDRLQQTLNEEKKADEKLTTIAVDNGNPKAKKTAGLIWPASLPGVALERPTTLVDGAVRSRRRGGDNGPCG